MYTDSQQTQLLGLTDSLIQGNHHFKPAQLIENLTRVLNYHDWRYYVLSDSKLKDYDYDMLFKQLSELEKQHPELKKADSPTHRVAFGLSSDFENVAHNVPMLSLDNSYNEDDLIDFDRRVKLLSEQENIAYCVEPKFDGAGIALVYENNQLVRAATRGNGTMGDDITTNARVMRTIPLSADFVSRGIAKAEVRGEVLIEKSAFESLNKKRAERNLQLKEDGKKELELFKHARNTASGGLRVKNPQEVINRGMEAFIYQIGYAIDSDGNNLLDTTLLSHRYNIQLLGELGFKVPSSEIRKFDNIKAVVDYCREWEEKRDDYNYEIDGMVVKVDNLKDQKKIGATSHHPRWAIAYKFKAQHAQTTLEGVDFQVGRTGAITPVAKLKPVQLTGVTISSVSLHNEDFIIEKDIQLNDTVVVERAGEVIPYIVKVNTDKRNKKCQPIDFPKNCPSCQSVLVKPEGESVWRCESASCPAQLEERLIHFVSKGAMNIDGLGRDIVKRFLKEGIISSVASIYTIDYDAVLALDGWKEKSVENLRNGIETSKQNPIWRLMVGLGIRHIGATTAKMLSAQIERLTELGEWTEEDLLNLHDVGPKVAQSIQDFFSNEQNKELLFDLRQLGISVENQKSTNTQPQLLQGKTFLFTGKLIRFTRDEAKEMVEQSGGSLLSGVSKKLNYLVAGEKAGSKLKKAETIESIQIISEDEFLSLLPETL